MEDKDIYAEISSIKSLMERSSKFISLSGLTGILAGIYALIGACIGYQLVGRYDGLSYRSYPTNDPATLWKLAFVAIGVLVLSLITGIVLTIRKAKRKGQSISNPVSKRLAVSLFIPLLTGGLLILILLFNGLYGLILPACLIFYGLALVAGSQYTYNDVKSLGLCELLLGLLAATYPGYGLVFWTIGFSFLHIIYGGIMHFKYDR